MNGCDKNDEPRCVGVDCLPPATQTGAGTFGCLVNGVPYFALGGVDCQYQFVDGGYYLGVGYGRQSGFPLYVGLGSSLSEVMQGETYILNDAADGNKFAEVAFLFDPNLPGLVSNTTNNIQTGTLTITKLDQANQIVSGTFEFEIMNPNDNQIYSFTEGRFDSFFTR